MFFGTEIVNSNFSIRVRFNSKIDENTFIPIIIDVNVCLVVYVTWFVPRLHKENIYSQRQSPISRRTGVCQNLWVWRVQKGGTICVPPEETTYYLQYSVFDWTSFQKDFFSILPSCSRSISKTGLDYNEVKCNHSWFSGMGRHSLPSTSRFM